MDKENENEEIIINMDSDDTVYCSQPSFPLSANYVFLAAGEEV